MSLKESPMSEEPSGPRHAAPRPYIHGRLLLEVRAPGGAVVATRRATNTVTRSGARFLASLFTGQATTGINGLAVGTANTPLAPPYDVTALTTEDADGRPTVLRAAAALPADAFGVEVLPDDLRVRVHVRGVLPAHHGAPPDESAATVALGEAALGVLAADGGSLVTIYNRVVFEPIPKGRDHELALYWEISFPFGD